MIVDPSLWTAFHIAKDALIGALETPIPECGHILAYPPADREQFRSDVQRTIDALAEELRQIRLVQARLSETQNYLVKSVGEAQLALSPVGLPVELLESVVNYAAGPERHRTIIYLSHVCSRWRSIVLGERSLFTHADWNRWPTWLLELWCSRSRGAPLTIELRSRALERIEDAGEERYSQTLLATKPFWESIRVEGSASLDPARYDFLFSSPLPSLCQLEFHSTTLSFRKPIQFTILSSPHLRTLSVTGTVPRSEQSLSELRELTLVPTFRTPWYMWTEILRSVPSLVCLTLTSTAGLMMDLSGRHFTLPSLTSLVLMHERQPRSPPLFTSLLSVFSFPNLKSAKLVHFSNELYQSVPLLTALTQAAPRVACLSIDDTSLPSEGGMGLHLIETISETPSHLPSLAELHHLGSEQPIGPLFIGYYETCIHQLVDSRNIHSLEVPILSQSYADELQQRLRSFQVRRLRH